MSRSAENGNEKAFAQQTEENKDSPFMNNLFSDKSHQNLQNPNLKAESESSSSKSLPTLDLFDSKDQKEESSDQKKGSNSEASNEMFKLPSSDSKDSEDSKFLVKAEPYEIELPSKTMAFSLFGSPTEHFASLGRDIKMPPAETGAKVDFTLKRQSEGGYCLTAKSGNKEWVLKDGLFSNYWKEVGK